ncbi:B3 domain-containing protein Os01g0234100 [Cucurbita maxima]|uniref:B3 domain-containing protein Os01g0234100 n=1 Tax=Cucurbita maxima TaxID=3661 RepID=A0A6J1IV59_CUCMA|nr:B3 domain-containing protein Os01g0234100 [Cucurbita maxima]
MNRGRPRKEKLFRRKSWASITPPGTSYDQETAQSFSHPRSVKFKRTTIDSIYNDRQSRSIVMAQAKEVQAKLPPGYPSFIKVMLPSHITGGFWLGLPRGFCDSHLPRQDTAMILQDESGMGFQTKYLSEKTGLSAGWRGFSLAHNLQQGDVLVFHLVMPNKFMVYIVRSNAVAEDGGAPGFEPVYIVRSNAVAEDGGAPGFERRAYNKQTPLYSKENVPYMKEKQMALDNVNSKEADIHPVKNEECDNPVSLAIDIHKDHGQTSDRVHKDTEMMPVLEESENNRNSFGSNSMNGIRLSNSTPDFEKVKSLNDFIISVNGLIIDSEFSSHVRAKYFELCSSQKAFLHEHILEGLNYKLVSGIISETINIADAIRACKVGSTSQEHFTTWDKSLTAFEGLGMNVAFLRSRIYRLLTLSIKIEMKRKAELKRDSTQEEIRTLVAKIMEARSAVKQLEAEIQCLENTDGGGNMETLFKEVASAPW